MVAMSVVKLIWLKRRVLSFLSVQDLSELLTMEDLMEVVVVIPNGEDQEEGEELQIFV